MDRFPLSPVARARLERIGRDFQIAFYTTATERKPHNVYALAELGHVLTSAGRYEEGLRVDERLVRIEPDNPTAHYNHACSLALLDRPAAAMDALERAVELGYGDVAHLLRDEDLASLRGEPRFRSLVRRLEAESEHLGPR